MILDDLETMPLFFAYEANLTAINRGLLAFGVDGNTKCFYGTALQAASAEGHLDVVVELLEYSAYINAPSDKLGIA